MLIRDGTALAYEDAGHGEPAVVLVHGVACNRAFMAPQAQFLKATHRVVAIDLRGHGDSDAPRQRYTIGALADDVAWMCERLDVGRVVVVGHSLGGLVALEVAAASEARMATASCGTTSASSSVPTTTPRCATGSLTKRFARRRT